MLGFLPPHMILRNNKKIFTNSPLPHRVIYYRVIFQFGPSTPNYSNLGHCIPIWSLFRIPVFQLGSFWGRIFHFGPFSSTYIPMCPPVMELFQYGPHRCRLSVVAGVLGGTHCESVWSRFGMVMLRPFYVRY